MSDCCSKSSSKSSQKVCPECGGSCRGVEMITLFHNVKFPNNQTIEEGDYYFCASEKCETGYFTAFGTIIPKAQLKANREIQQGWLCYCYDISVAQYRDALQANTAEPIKTFVIEQTKSGSCACEIRNPSGQCCLAKFRQLEKEHEKS